jgi:hypothetical protein
MKVTTGDKQNVTYLQYIYIYIYIYIYHKLCELKSVLEINKRFGS